MQKVKTPKNLFFFFWVALGTLILLYQLTSHEQNRTPKINNHLNELPYE